jgi:hypothetical protein
MKVARGRFVCHILGKDLVKLQASLLDRDCCNNPQVNTFATLRDKRTVPRVTLRHEGIAKEDY